MANLSDINNTPLSGLNHIDALLDQGPDWNFLTPVGNVIRYTFSVNSGNESTQSGQQAFSAAQQANARAAMSYLSSVTGITFVETSVGTDAQVHLCSINIAASNTTGLCSWSASYTYNPADNSLASYNAQAYVYLDNAEFGAQNANLSPGSEGYETLLHELGHMLGLKHPFEGAIRLPSAQDNTDYSLLSYTDIGAPHTTFSPYDLATLNWLYGGDGLRGALGVNSTTGARYITGTASGDTLTGTSAADVLEGKAGNDALNGGAGDDTAVYSGNYASYTLTELAGGNLQISGQDGVDTLNSIENLRFANNVTIRRSDVGGSVLDTTAPVAPSLVVAKNAAGYVTGNAPFVSGQAEANAIVKIYNGSTLLATTVANASGTYGVSTAPLADGAYAFQSTATDAAGNVSTLSAGATFNVDVNAPVTPTASISAGASGIVVANQPTISGTGEAGTTISLISVADGVRAVVASTTVGAGGTWSATPSPLVNGSYNFTVKSTDGAGNSVERANAVTFTVASSLNTSGATGNETFTAAAGNNAIDGKGGVDTVRYANSKASYTVSKTETGFSVNGTEGLDTLVNVERIQFANGALALDIDGIAGKSYRIYKAAFDRAPDLVGVGFWIDSMDKGQTLNQVAQGFLNSNEFSQLYGANADNNTFVTKLYANVLHRQADGDGFAYWLNVLNTNATSRADVLSYFSESSENQAQVIGQIQNGFEYTVWAG